MNVELRKRLREGATDLGLTDLPLSTVRRAQQSLCEDLSNHKRLREPMRSDGEKPGRTRIEGQRSPPVEGPCREERANKTAFGVW